MGKATDMTGLQFRMLNKKKGPAVWSPRAQCDKKAYQFRLKWICESEPNLDVKQGQSSRILYKGGAAFGVETTLEVQYHGQIVIITTGTFLRGLMHIGTNQQSGGRAGDSAATDLSGSLKKVGLELARLKTGTPPRLLRRSIDFTKTETQWGDEPIPYFTYWKDDLFHMEQERGKFAGGGDSGWQISTRFRAWQDKSPVTLSHHIHNRATADLIRSNLHKSPMYSGIIEGIGPRYCPSIEDKIVKFAEKERHQIFLRTGRDRNR